jgi:hypothetical protein
MAREDREMEEIRYHITDLSELEHKLITNALKVWRGDFGSTVQTEIWHKEITELLKKIGVIQRLTLLIYQSNFGKRG